MPVRRTLSALLSRSVERKVREWIDAATRRQDEELQQLRAELGRLDRTPAAAPAADAERLEKLEKKLSMTMGAIQAASAQILQLKEEAEQARNLAQQAMQRASSAQATAEAAAEGISALEDRLEAAPAPVVSATAAAPAAVEPTDDERCSVPGCTGKHRARGYCAKHYQQWKRGTLEA